MTASAPAPIDVAELSYAYPDGTRALDGVTFSAGSAAESGAGAGTGAIVGLLGRNGAGKTTLLEILVGLRRPDRGTARIAGFDAGTRQARASVGYLPHESPVYRDMTVAEYLRFAAGLRGKRPDLAPLAERLGLGDLAGAVVGTLSRGLRQRVGLAAAVACEPAVLVLDEPTTGLDPSQLAGVRELVRDAARTSLVLFSTHVLSEAAELCTWLVVLDAGRVTAAGTPDEIAGDDGLESAFARLTGPVQEASAP